MSRYDGLIIPRSYSEYINKTDAATLLQALQQSGVMDAAPTANSNHPVKSGGVYNSIDKINYDNAITDLNYAYEKGKTKTYILDGGAQNVPNNTTSWYVLSQCNPAIWSGNNYITQIATNAANNTKNEIYIRHAYKTGSVVAWTAWRKITTNEIETVSFTVVTAFGTITIKKNGQIVQALMNGSNNAGIAPGTSIASGLPHPITTNFIPVYKYSDQTIEGFLILDGNGYLYAYNGNTKNLGACVFNFSYIAE
jgi:hypothetical protein